MTEDDAPALRVIAASDAVAAWWGPVADRFPLADEPQASRFVILVDGKIAGLIQFGEELDPEYRHAWIDIFLDPARHGEGLGTDALRTLVAYLVEERGHHRITIDPALDNKAAIRSYEKAGFRAVGVLHAAWRDGWTGEWRDTLLMELVSRASQRDA
jgi:aminoglycoside 6'-N-acetyltransferase